MWKALIWYELHNTVFLLPLTVVDHLSQHDIRRATRSDFDAVVGIGEVYNGRDYLRFRYNSFLDDPNIRSYVYMGGGHVIGFSANFLIDGAPILLFRGGRVKASFQGQGIFRTLKTYIRQQYQSTESVKYEVLSTNNVNVSARPSLRESFTELSYKLPQNGDVSLLTIGTSKPLDAGRMYHLDMFGSDVTSLRYHVLSHLHHTMTFSKDAISYAWHLRKKRPPYVRIL